MTVKENQQDQNLSETVKKDLPAAAIRALAEAEQRRLKLQKDKTMQELGGRGGEDPVRYGDWEIKGRAIDF